MKNLGVHTVIDLRQEDRTDEAEIVRSLGMTYINIPMDDHDRPYDDQVAKFLTLVKDTSKGPFFVHCAGGRHRTGIMTACYRMSVDGWNADRAYKEMKGYGFFTAFGHKAYKTYVYDYYNRLAHAGVTAPAADTKVATERTVTAGAARN